MRCAFCTGYLEAIEETAYDPTPGEVERARPEYGGQEILEYINGVTDAMQAETFRLRLHHKNGAECEVDVNSLVLGAYRLRARRADPRPLYNQTWRSPAPAVEVTPQGPQTLVDGTPQRTLPSTPLRAKRRQADLRDTPLFGQDRAAVERSQEELPL